MSQPFETAAESGPVAVKTFKGHKGSISAIAMFHDRKRFVTVSWDRTIRIWDMEGEEEEGQEDLLLGHTDVIRSVAVSRDGKWLASGGDDQTIRLQNLEDRASEPTSMTCDGWVYSVDFTHDGLTLATGTFSKNVSVRAVPSLEALLEPIACSDSVYCVKFSPKGDRLASAAGCNISIWDPESGALLVGPMEGHRLTVTSLAWSPDGQKIVSASSDESLRLWNCISGEQISDPMYGHDSHINSVAFSPNGKLIVSASFDRTARVWSVETAEQIAWYSHSLRVSCAVFTIDGKRVLSAGSDNIVYLWDSPVVEDVDAENSSFLDLPAVVAEEATSVAQGSALRVLDDILDLPATHRPRPLALPQNRPDTIAPTRLKLMSRIWNTLRGRRRSAKQDIEMSSPQNEPNVVEIAAAKSKKFIVVAGSPIRSQQVEPSSEQEESEPSERSPSPSTDSDDEHTGCWYRFCFKTF
ncbi:hypothetical protein HYDPIDRAFT_114290 [Hydnomerulius pinastri MD-312]|uniref:WD40 repeat-like protein n=1 Tax=Hydnomerulius pinastri MD-312 TaxID=994086 RepID=A0A0C9WD17_9AGAM|nr:hypothetical protein HYDPIDRAFT_114290 [Hydnomerulius pinastri MD-312]